MKENILDNYALKRLSASDKTLLQKALSSDPNFQQELDFHCDIIKGIETHMEQLFDAALVDVLVYADQDLKNIIQQADIELDSENFFQTKSNKPIETIIEKVPVVESLKNDDDNAVLNINETSSPKTQATPITIPSHQETIEEVVAPTSTLPSNKEAEKEVSFSASKTAIVTVIAIIVLLLIWYFNK